MTKKTLKKKKGSKPAAKKRPKNALRAFTLGDRADEIPSLTVWSAELRDMMDVLEGREEPPIDAGVMTLQEVADGYYARAGEMTMYLQQLEREGVVTKSSHHYRFRTGELRTFMEVAKRASDLGSRRLTDEQLRFEQSRLGRESRGFR